MTRELRSRVLVGAAVAVLTMGYFATTGSPADLASGTIPDRLGAPANAASQVALGPAGAVVSTTVPLGLVPSTPPTTSTTSPVGLPPVGAPSAAPPPVTAPPAPSTAPAVTPRRVPLADAVRRHIEGDWESVLPGWTVSFEGPRRGYKGSTYPARRRIEVYVRPGQGPADIAHVLAHELGHAIDVTYFTDAERAAFNSLRGRHPGHGWWVGPGGNDFASGSGDWAECFAWMVTGGRGGFFSRLGSPPDAAQQRQMRAILDQKLLSA